VKTTGFINCLSNPLGQPLLFRISHLEHLQHFVAVVVDDLAMEIRDENLGLLEAIERFRRYDVPLSAV
jgi:hypothetical protein